MPNYKASNFWFPNRAAMMSFFVDATDEDGLVFGVGEGETEWGMYAWRKNSNATVDNARIFPANGIGRWVRLSVGEPDTPEPDDTLPGIEDDTLTPAWDTITAAEWESITESEWEAL